MSDRLPRPGHVGYLPNRGPSRFQRQAKKLRGLLKEADRACSLVEIDVSRQDARLDVGRRGIEVIGR